MTPMVAIGLLAAYLLLCVEVYLATYCLSTFKMSFARVGPTELRMLLALGNAATVWLHPDPHVVIAGVSGRLFDVAGLAATIGLVMAFIAAAVQNTRRLYQAEPRM
jgi:hypothetical protein